MHPLSYPRLTATYNRNSKHLTSPRHISLPTLMSSQRWQPSPAAVQRTADPQQTHIHTNPGHQDLSTDGCPLSACVLLYECCRELGSFSLHNASILCQTLRQQPTAPSSLLLQVPPESQGYKVWRMAVNRTSKDLPTLNCDWVHFEGVVDRCFSQESRKSICNDASLESHSFHFVTPLHAWFQQETVKLYLIILPICVYVHICAYISVNVNACVDIGY